MSVQELVQKVSFESICPHCEIVKSSRTYHCSICAKCVERYDHHCPWINNCVGVGNHIPFIVLVLVLVVYFFASLNIAFVAMVAYLRYMEDCNDFNFPYEYFCDSDTTIRSITGFVVMLCMTVCLLFGFLLGV